MNNFNLNNKIGKIIKRDENGIVIIKGTIPDDKKDNKNSTIDDKKNKATHKKWVFFFRRLIWE